MIQNSRYVVGLDIGYSNVKISCGDENVYELEVSVYPAYATSEPDLALAKKGEHEIKVFPNRSEWRVFTNRVGHRELHGKYHTSEMYMTLFYGALIIKRPEGHSNVIDVLNLSH